MSIQRSHTTASTRPSAPSTTNTQRQPNWWVIQPISGANRAVAKYCAELKTAVARPRSAVGNQAVATRAFAGNAGDSKTPSRSRSPKTTATDTSTGVVMRPTRLIAAVTAVHSARLRA